MVILHGGPFSASPYDVFSNVRNFYLALDYSLLIINYRGSIGYGKDSLDSLLGTIGENDVVDCGSLTQLALEKHGDIIDESKVCV
mmetsp:Transcript_41086/g.55806  ORF Transcript_41086/g.55806 Transcript_41086/m.55806 type:complete len:85 (+) Transcript_41086:1184-1438(+)